MKNVKIVIIGAGSASFGGSCIKDAFSMRELWGCELVLADINADALQKMVKVAMRMNDELNAGFKISYTVDRCEALMGAHFVITSIAVNRDALWKLDFEIPKKHGVKHVLGENGGPGAVFHTMRNIPIILDICKDIERLCPEALLINFTNPESRICLAINKYTRVRAVGLCHQIGYGIGIVSRILGLPYENIDVKAFGLNHFTWMTDIRNKKTGEDLYPRFDEALKTYDPEYEKLSRFMYQKFGLFPTSGDDHLGEFIPYAHEMMSTKGFDFEHMSRLRGELPVRLDKMADKSIPIEGEMLQPSGEKAFHIIRGMVFNTNEYIDSANLPNNGYITNLPSDAIVEVPVIVSGSGVRGVGMGELPRAVASLCRNQIDVQHLVVDAGVTGDRELVMQALLVDPNVPGAETAQKIFDELMEINKPYLPQFR